MKTCFLLISLLLSSSVALAQTPPNLVVIYVDDLGYGDTGCYGATTVRTPNIDRLAREGCLFRDGHSTAATCTPSRYSLLTGEYAWRQKGTGIAPGDANLIIRPGRVTLASMLQTVGYRSAAVGKWHLGLGDGAIDWNKPISPGPREIGFDESFLIPATGDRVPCVYVENQLVVGLQSDDPITVSFQEQVGNDPTGLDQPELLKMKWHHGHNATIVNGISRIGFMAGGKTARWIDEDMADVITTKAVNFIDRHMAAHRSQPFFLYFNPHDIHVPRVPHPRFIGSTSMGPRGDAIAELDWCVGEILNSLDQHGISKNTIVLFTSDNGPVLNDGYVDEAVDRAGEHRPAGPFRGGKYSAFEAGTRVPFLIRWPVRIAGGSTSDALVCQIDLLRSMASLLQHSLPQDAAPDSLDALNALLGTDAAGRDHLVEQAGTLALRQGTWKLIMPGKGPAVSRQVNIETGNSPEVQLYDLSADPGETENVAGQNSDRVREMIALLESIQKNGTPR